MFIKSNLCSDVDLVYLSQGNFSFLVRVLMAANLIVLDLASVDDSAMDLRNPPDSG